MKRPVVSLLALLLSPLALAPAKAQLREPIYVNGLVTCEVFLQAVEANDEAALDYVYGWTYGFLAGFQGASDITYSRLPDRLTIKHSIAKWCREYPDELILFPIKDLTKLYDPRF